MLSLNPSQTSLRPANLSGKIGIGRSSGGVSITVSVGVYTTSVEAGDEADGVYTTSVEAGDEADGAQNMLYCSSSGIQSQYRSGFKTWPSSHLLAHWNGNTLAHLS